MIPSAAFLAAFVTPALFWGGAAAVAAPILIHILARRRFRRIRWAAMDFLIDAERRNRRRLRMEEWILLALRCLAVVLLAATVARPFFQPGGLAAGWGSQRTERVFLLDDSMSMAYELPDGTVFQRAQHAVRRLVQMFRVESPDDTVTLIRMTEATAPVESGTYLDDQQTGELVERLDALSPTQQSVDVSSVVEGLVENLERNPGITNAAIYVVSDFQRNDWTIRSSAEVEEDATAGLLRPLIEWSEEGGRGCRIVLVDVAVESPSNLAVTDLAIEGGQLVAGATGTVKATVGNFSEAPVENLELQLRVGNLPQPSKRLRALAPQQQASVEMEAEFVRGGFETVRVDVPTDALPADNVRHAATEVAGAVRILLVNGEPSTDLFEDELLFLSAALRPEGDVFSGNELVVVDETEIEEVVLPRFHVVILANVYRLSEPTIDALEQFVSRGGGLVFFLGDQVDAGLYNAAFFREGRGLLPAALTELIRAPDAAHLVVADRLHPALRGLSIEGDPLGISRVPFFRYFGSEPAGGSETVEAGDAPRSRQRPARVIARFDDATETPAIVERRFGRGRVVLMTTTADKEWHAWPDHPTFLPVMMELVRHVSRQEGVGTGFRTGEPIVLPLEPALYEPDVIVRTPAYPNEREFTITATPVGGETESTPPPDATPGAVGAGLVLRWEHTGHAGIYQFILRKRDEGEVIRPVAVNVDARESDLSRAREAELRKAFGSLPVQYIRGTQDLAAAAGEARVEFWQAFLFAAAMVLMAEQGLAWWWGRRR